MAKKESQALNLVLTAAIVATIALPTGYLIGVNQKSNSENMSTNSDQPDEDHEHTHEQFEVAKEIAPSISNLTVTTDAKSGWNISFETENFTFAPENASNEHVDGEGHAHLYIDGEKVTRLYSEDFFIDSLGEVGERTVMVTLNTNDHKEYAVNGESVMTMTTIKVEEGDSHSHIESEHSDHQEHEMSTH